MTASAKCPSRGAGHVHVVHRKTVLLSLGFRRASEIRGQSCWTWNIYPSKETASIILSLCQMFQLLFIFLECKTIPSEGDLFLNQYKNLVDKPMKPLLWQSWSLLAICHLLQRWGGKACPHWAVVPLKAFHSVTSRQCSAPRSPAPSGPCYVEAGTQIP